MPIRLFGAGSGGGQIVVQGAGQVEVVAQPSVGRAAHGAKRVDDEGDVVAANEVRKAAPGKASVYPLVGVVRLPKTLAESKLAGAPALAGRQSAEVDPSPDGVVTDPQQLTCLTDPHRWHQ